MDDVTYAVKGLESGQVVVTQTSDEATSLNIPSLEDLRKLKSVIDIYITAIDPLVT